MLPYPPAWKVDGIVLACWMMAHASRPMAASAVLSPCDASALVKSPKDNACACVVAAPTKAAIVQPEMVVNCLRSIGRSFAWRPNFD